MIAESIEAAVDRRRGAAPARLDDASRELAGNPDHVRFARILARRFSARFPQAADEFESAAYLGLVEAARSYEPSAGITFASYAYRRITGSMCDFARSAQLAGFRKGGQPPRVHGMDDPIGDNITFADIVEAGEDPVGTEIESADRIEALLSPLPRRIRAIMTRAYTKPDATNAKLARRFRISEARVHQLRVEGLAMLRKIHAGGAP